MAAVVVTDTLDWKLHGFDLLSEHSSVLGSPLHNNIWMVGNQYKPGELAKGEWELVPQNPPWAVDAWGLGCLIQEMFSGESLNQAEDLRRTDTIPEALLTDYQRLLGSRPAKRLNPAKVAKSQFVHNQTVDVVSFLENLAVKDSVEKDSFFRKLPNILPSLPEPVAQRKILPMLSSALEYGGAPAIGLSCILQIGKQLNEEEFAERVIPVISRLFSSTDRSIRRSLLENIDRFSHHLTGKIVEEEIYPQLQTGFSDTNAYLREMTLKSMRSLAPKMSQRLLNQSLLKFLAKLQVDQEPTIRANTTILLGNIAKLLGEASCKRVLLNAFGRALRDSFPPAKIAGLKGLAATVELHGAEDAAQKVVPLVAPLTIDSTEDVRKGALECLDLFIQVLKDNDVKMARLAANQGQGASDNKADASGSTATGSYLSWAVSSLGLNKSVPGDGDASTSTSLSAGSNVTMPIGGSQEKRYGSPKASNQASSSAETTNQTTDASSQGMGNVADGWENDLDEFEEDKEELEARSRLSRRGARAQRAEPSARPASLSQDGTGVSDGWNDGLDSVFEDMGMKASRPSAVGGTSDGSSRPTQRRGAGGKKPMRLGAQRLKQKTDFGDLQ